MRSDLKKKVLSIGGVAEMRFLCRVAYQVAASLTQEEPVDMVSSIRHILLTLGQTQELLEILYLTLGSGLAGDCPRQAGICGQG